MSGHFVLEVPVRQNDMEVMGDYLMNIIYIYHIYISR